MIVDKYGRVAGSIDLATLAQMYAQVDDPDLKAHYRDVAAEHGHDLGDATETPVVEADRDDRDDGVHSVGGGWHEVVVDGQVIDKIRGADAAQDAYEAAQEASSGNDDVS
jgi:hypothetical protein